VFDKFPRLVRYIFPVLLSPLSFLIRVLRGCIILFPEFSLPFGFIGLKSVFADLLRLCALYTATRAVTVGILYSSIHQTVIPDCGLTMQLLRG